MIKLVKIADADKKETYEMLQNIGEMENNFNNEVKGKSYEYFESWINKMIAWDFEENLPEGYVRQATFILLDKSYPIGIGKVRYGLTDESKKWGGTIGYAIRQECRGQGFGYILVKKLIEYAKGEGIHEIVATIMENNKSSIAITEKANGTMYDKHDGVCYYTFV